MSEQHNPSPEELTDLASGDLSNLLLDAHVCVKIQCRNCGASAEVYQGAVCRFDPGTAMMKLIDAKWTYGWGTAPDHDPDWPYWVCSSCPPPATAILADFSDYVDEEEEGE